LDAHKRECQAAWIDREGKVQREERFPTSPSRLRAFAASTGPEDRVVVEASSTGRLVYKLLRDAGVDVHLAHPAGVALIAKAKVKTDERDAEVLAQLLRMGYLPEAYVPPDDIQVIRDVVRFRVGLTHKIVAAKNQVHALLMWNGVEMDESDVFGKAGLEKLSSIELPPHHRALLDLRLREVLLLAEQIGAVEGTMASLAEGREDVRRLMTMPGVSFYSALVIVGEVGDFRRFPTAKRLASWAGLAPSVRQSGDRARTGHITKKGSSLLRWILEMCATAAVKMNTPSRRVYAHLKRKGHGIAVTAVARKMLCAMWSMIVHGRDYDHAIEHNVRRKAMEMRRKARKARPASDLAATVTRFTESIVGTIEKEVSAP
jgi:transposase